MDDVATRIPDLFARNGLADLLKPGTVPPADTVKLLLDRIAQPGTSISGYNPQRLT